MTFGAPVISATYTSGFTKRNGNNLGANGDLIGITARIPIEGWNNSNIIIGSFNGLQTCVDTKSCTDTFSAVVSSAGVVSGENVDWINGNASIGGTSVYSLSYNTGIFTAEPTCVMTAQDAANFFYAQEYSRTTSSISVMTSNGTAQVAKNFRIICQKQGADYIGKTAMAVASDQNVRSIGSTNVDIQSVYFGSGANCSTVCSTGTCTICSQTGNKITSVSFSGTGIYLLNGIDGTKYNCTGSGSTPVVNVPLVHDRPLSTTSIARLVGQNSLGVTVNLAYNSAICIGIP
jgi:hypothetical protein